MSYRQSIILGLTEVFEEEGVRTPADFPDDLVLLECDLDSLGFAVLVTKLSESLGFDPFVESQEQFTQRPWGSSWLFMTTAKLRLTTPKGIWSFAEPEQDPFELVAKGKLDDRLVLLGERP